MCLKEFFISFVFSILVILIYAFFINIVYRYKTYCLRKEWKNRNSIFFKFLLGKVRSYLFYFLLSIVLALSIIANLLTLKLFEIFLLTFSITFTIWFSNKKLNILFSNLNEELASYINSLVLYRFLVLFNGIVWFLAEFFFYEIDLKYMEKVISSNMTDCYLYSNLYKYTIFIEYIFWSLVLELKSHLNLLLNIALIIFILIKKISFLWGVILAVLGGKSIWKT